MEKHVIVLPDGTEISSGTSGDAVMSVCLTREVNTDTLLSPGAVSAAMLQISVLSSRQRIQTGDLLEMKNADDGSLIGTFVAQEPVCTGQIQTVTAYDRMIQMDREVSELLSRLRWPVSLYELADQVCEYCGLPLENRSLPCGDFPAVRPLGDGITGRQMLSWIGQAVGCFCQVNGEGRVEFGWYQPGQWEIAPRPIGCLSGVLTLSEQPEDGVLTLGGETEDGILTLSPRQYALSGGLKLESSPVCPIDRVQIRQTESDVGLLCPDTYGDNTLVIQGNPLLAAADSRSLLPIAENLYQRFLGISYTPGTLKLPTTPGLQVGQELRVIDGQGVSHRFLVMRLQRDASGDTVTCTGSQNRSSPKVVNNRSYQNLQGRMLQLRTDVEGIRAENSDNQGKLATLSLDVEGLRGTVSSQQAQGDALLQRLTTLEQTASGLEISVESLRTQGADKLKTAMGYVFDDSGLRIARSGEPMENRLDNTGMQVLRLGQPILQADHRGVSARDVSVENYLIVGSHARFEDYAGGRTACFWLEGAYAGIYTENRGL